MNHLEMLNSDQKEAVCSEDGAILVLAGAGSGKTRVITERILFLSVTGKAMPNEILSITFTNKAANEMKERSISLLKKSPLRNTISESEPFISTFHSLGVHILRRHGKDLGILKRFSIYDRSDSLKIIKDILKRKDLDPKMHPPKKFLSIISKHKGNALTPNSLELEASSFFENILMEVWSEYDLALEKENALDFDDLLLKTYILLKENESVRKEYSNKWKFIQIDEYQDTNKVQYYIARMLASHGNIFAVGDADQNIYSWRGARLENILNFQKDFPNAKLITLSTNYRSTKNIIEVAERIIEKNTLRLPKEVKTLNSDGEPVRLFVAGDEKKEAEFIAQKTLEKIADGIPKNEIAVLYRTHFQSRILEEEFLKEGIPYQVIGIKFFERKEVKDVLSFLEAAMNPESHTHLSRIINVPPRGVGKVTLLKILAGKKNDLSGQMKSKVDNFFKLLEKIEKAVETLKPSEVLKLVIEDSGLKKLFEEGSEEDRERLLNIEELVTLAQKYDHLEPREGMEKLLEEAALATKEEDLDENDQGRVKLLTVHSAKGLEFDVVFIAGLEEGLFPIVREEDSLEEKEEERRLFYVATTRAGKILYLTYATSRLIYGTREISLPSTFLMDVEELLSLEEEAIRTFYLE